MLLFNYIQPSERPVSVERDSYLNSPEHLLFADGNTQHSFQICVIPSNNYILDLDSTNKNIDISYFQDGFYTVALVCNGQILDAKTFIKQ